MRIHAEHLDTRWRKWDNRFLDMAEMVASWSKDPSMKCGAVLVNGPSEHGPARQIFSVGYNGFPRGADDRGDRLLNRETKYKLIVHAEENAILAAQGASFDATLYVHTGMETPCIRCCTSIIQAGVNRVVGRSQGAPVPEQWQESMLEGRALLDECGVGWVVYPYP